MVDPVADLREAAAVLDELAHGQREHVRDAVRLLDDALLGGGKVIAFGNGGSAAAAQHLAAELVGRFRIERAALPAVALSADGAVVTALGNDFGQEFVFSRQIEALAAPLDVLVAITTSARSANVLEGVRVGRNRGCAVLALAGRFGGRLAEDADVCLEVPCDDIARIQEAHLVLTHAICRALESSVAARDLGAVVDAGAVLG
jgi:D-sedoheptulose 7-phosphate isomerase